MEVLSNFTSVLPCPIRSLLGTKACNKPSPMETRKIKPSESAVPDQPDLSSKPSFEVVESGLIWCDHSSPQHRGDKMSQSSRNSETKKWNADSLFWENKQTCHFVPFLFWSFDFPPVGSEFWTWHLLQSSCCTPTSSPHHLATSLSSCSFATQKKHASMDMFSKTSPPSTSKNDGSWSSLFVFMSAETWFTFASCKDDKNRSWYCIMFMFPTESIHLCLQQPHSPLNFDKLQNSITHPVPPAVPMIPMMWRITSCEETGLLEKIGFLPCNVHSIIFPHVSPSLEVTPSVSFPETLIRLSIAKPQTTLDDL